MSKQHILIIEDEQPIRSMLRYALELAEFNVSEAPDTSTAAVLLKDMIPDLIILDWMLPCQSGVDFLKTLRKEIKWQNIPVMMLTAKAEEESKVAALEAGADDYLVKPFSPAELIARIRAILRRGPILSEYNTIKVGKIELDEKNKRVEIDKVVVRMGPLEFRLLHFFMTHQNRVYSRAQLLDYVWGADKFIDERTVDVHIRRLRRRLVPSGCHRFIQTVHGSGYRFSEHRDYA